MLLLRVPRFLSDSNSQVLLGDQSLHAQIVKITAIIKSREPRLTPTILVYLLLGLSLYRFQAIPEVLQEILVGLGGLLGRVRGLVSFAPAESSIAEGRYRLGVGPLKALFEATAACVSPPPTFHGLRVHAIDGVRFIVADTKENVEEFGRPKVRQGQAGYPVALVVARVDVHSHRVGAIHIQPHNGGERVAVPELVMGLDSGDLVLLDRGFPSVQMLRHLTQVAKVHVLVRIPTRWQPEVVAQQGTGDYIVRIPYTDSGKRRKRPQVVTAASSRGAKRGRKPVYETQYLILRMLTYQCGQRGTVRLLTDLLEPSIPGIELAKLYHERWEIELTIDEVKNHFAVGFQGRPDLTVRSKKPIGVRQELYAMFTMFNHTRTVIASAAAAQGLQPLDISFTKALHTIRRYLPLLVYAATASPDDHEKLLNALYNEMCTRCRARKRRPRHYPRKVKIKMSGFDCKRESDRQTISDLVALTRMVNPAPGLGLAA